MLVAATRASPEAVCVSVLGGWCMPVRCVMESLGVWWLVESFGVSQSQFFDSAWLGEVYKVSVSML